METRAVHLPIDLYHQVRASATKNRRTVPGQLRVIVEEWEKMLDRKK